MGGRVCQGSQPQLPELWILGSCHLLPFISSPLSTALSLFHSWLPPNLPLPLHSIRFKRRPTACSVPFLNQKPVPFKFKGQGGKNLYICFHFFFFQAKYQSYKIKSRNMGSLSPFAFACAAAPRTQTPQSWRTWSYSICDQGLCQGDLQKRPGEMSAWDKTKGGQEGGKNTPGTRENCF